MSWKAYKKSAWSNFSSALFIFVFCFVVEWLWYDTFNVIRKVLNPLYITNMAPSSNWLGKRAFNPLTRGSNPPGVTIFNMDGYTVEVAVLTVNQLPIGSDGSTPSSSSNYGECSSIG